jgi:hypothetical protein
VFYGDVHVGTIARRVGAPADVDQWSWLRGFYPGCDPGQHCNGTAATFDDARTDFEIAWRALLPTRTESDFSLARSAGLDGAKICYGEARRKDAVTETQ